MNWWVRYSVFGSLLAAGKAEEAEAELRKILEIEPQNIVATVELCTLLARRGELSESLGLAERVYAGPWSFRFKGLLAALLKRTGDSKRADELIRKLGETEEYQLAAELFWFHHVLGEQQKLVDVFKRWVELRVPAAAYYFRRTQAQYPGASWGGVAAMMNLPE